MATPALTLVTADLPDDCLSRIAVGDVVRTGQNRYPNYRVIAITADRAWVRDVQYGTDHVVPMDSIHKI